MSFESVNTHANPQAQARLKAHGYTSVPIVCVGDECVPGGDLEAVADLVGIAYQQRDMLPPEELVRRFALVIAASCRYIRQFPFEALSYKSPDRDRPVRVLGLHVMQLADSFLRGYDTGKLGFTGLRIPSGPLETLSGDQIAAFGETMKRALQEWWDPAGREDPLDRVIETSWGWHTLHEALERSCWHAAQHARQLMMFLGQIGIEPDGPLTPEDLQGLPLPDEVWG